MPGTAFQLEVVPKIPAKLERLNELANNLYYSWDRPTRTLFARMHSSLWNAVGHSPKAFLKRVDQTRLDEAAEDPVFLGGLAKVLSAYDTYMGEPVKHDGLQHLRGHDLVAYFCLEFGFHESLPIYSGGLGILAGDHCKAASDYGLPFIAVGLLYRQGYFLQTLDSEGRQTAHYNDTDYDDLPITAVLDADGAELVVDVRLSDHDVKVKAWQAQVGHIRLLLLDTDLEHNSAHDRDITHRLYGGDRTTRIEQEIILGMGGPRVLAALGLNPTVWHMNEGHAAFLVLERVHEMMGSELDFSSALEAVAANTIFTTHTPVPAGHDHFSDDMIQHYFEYCCRDGRTDMQALLALGRAPGGSDFNMTALAVRGSRFHNGVSRIHGAVSAEMLADMWPQIESYENPMQHVTNGVHAPTFLSADWHELYDRFLGPGWMHRLSDRHCWESIYSIPDNQFWNVHQSLKAQMLHLVMHRVAAQHARNHGSDAHLDRMLRFANPDNPNILTIGFARRFATYKRAALLFENLEWLRQIVCDPKRPVVFIFAGKAHPADEPGQALIRRVAEVAQRPEFESHILLVEGYDLQLARRMVSGVDVWLNTPLYPLEACGTSGMKAAINGVPNLSVLDGWWGEGCDGKNGWGIKSAALGLEEARRNQEESRTLYEILQDQLIPMYYNWAATGFSPDWVRMCKHSIVTLMPRFSAGRMIADYLARFYVPAAQQWRHYSSEQFGAARDVSAWKKRVHAAWPQLTLRRVDLPVERTGFGRALSLEVAANLGCLCPGDVRIELLLGRPAGGQRPQRVKAHVFQHSGRLESNEDLFKLDLTPEYCGKIEYHIRMYPFHALLTHPFEMGEMLWL